MARKPAADRERKYEELGHLIEKWRREKYRSGSALYRDVKLSFSYNSYVEFEGGSALPGIDQLLELADTLDQDPSEAVVVWARVQMPTEELKALFSPAAQDKPAPEEKRDATEAPAFEDTWVWGKPELEFIGKNPWFYEFCLKLVLAYPGEVTYAQLGLKDKAASDGFVHAYAKPWIEAGKIEATAKGMRIHFKHLYLPKTREWDVIRSRNLDRLLHGMDGTPDLLYREIVTRPLSKVQVEKVLAELKRVENSFKAHPYQSSPETAHSLVIVFGARKLRLPEL